MADDVEGQLSRLGAEQLGLQEGGPLLLQQPLAAHVVLGAWAESGCHATPPPLPLVPRLSAPPPPPPHWLLHGQPRPRPRRRTLQTRATRDVRSLSKNSNSLAVSSKKK